jgi:hypothetical protein
MTFRRLPGLPPYGAAATTFPPQWGGGAREGLVVEFATSDGNVWVGNFQPGIGGVDEVLSHPNGRDALVVSNGSLWIVNPVTRSADELASAVFNIWRVTDPDGYLLNNQGLGFVRLSPEGVLWKSRRISWDGFSDLRFEGEHLTGQAWAYYIEDGWLPFTLDLRTGKVEGGSYTDPEVELGF